MTWDSNVRKRAHEHMLERTRTIARLAQEHKLERESLAHAIHEAAMSYCGSLQWRPYDETPDTLDVVGGHAVQLANELRVGGIFDGNDMRITICLAKQLADERGGGQETENAAVDDAVDWLDRLAENLLRLAGLARDAHVTPKRGNPAKRARKEIDDFVDAMARYWIEQGRQPTQDWHRADDGAVVPITEVCRFVADVMKLVDPKAVNRLPTATKKVVSLIRENNL